MKIFAGVLAILPFFLSAQTPPRLIIGITIDQMRYEMLDRYRETFSSEGFNKLLRDGITYDSCTYQYIPTFTGPGHATIFTGTNPDEHGIVANDWYNPTLARTVYCVEDSRYKGVGTDDKKFARSPQFLQSKTLGEEILSVHSRKGKSFAISLKDRGSILPHGKKGNGAFWIDQNGNFATSSYFMKKLPGWVIDFNKRGLPDKYFEETWDLLLPAEAYRASLPDLTPYERVLLGESPVFPYPMPQLKEKYGKSILGDTPFGNTFLTEFAIALIRANQLGKDDFTDVLSVSYSSPDLVGHDFGPYSMEVQDVYLRLDREIAQLMNFLDEFAGRGQYLVFLTSDHGAANTPAHPGFSYASFKPLHAALNEYTLGRFGKELIARVTNFQIYLKNQEILEAGIDRNLVLADLMSFLSKQQVLPIEYMFTKSEVENCNSPDCMFFKNAYSSEYQGDINFTLPYGVVERSDYGTHHGSGYLYDRHVPFIIYGHEISPAVVKEPVSVKDIKGIVLEKAGMKNQKIQLP